MGGKVGASTSPSASTTPNVPGHTEQRRYGGIRSHHQRHRSGGDLVAARAMLCGGLPRADGGPRWHHPVGHRYVVRVRGAVDGPCADGGRVSSGELASHLRAAAVWPPAVQTGPSVPSSRGITPYRLAPRFRRSSPPPRARRSSWRGSGTIAVSASVAGFSSERMRRQRFDHGCTHRGALSPRRQRRRASPSTDVPANRQCRIAAPDQSREACQVDWPQGR